MNIRLSKHAPAPIWSGDCGIKNGRLTWPAPIQSLCSVVLQFYMCPWHHKCSGPVALSMFSAPGTITMFSAPGTFTMFTAQFSSPAQVDSGTTSLYRLPVHLGMELELPSFLWGSSGSPCSPWEWSGLWQDRSQCPLMVTGQSPLAQIVTALLVYVMASCTAWCWPVSLTVNVVHLQVFFHGKKLFFCMTSAVGWPADDMC